MAWCQQPRPTGRLHQVLPYLDADGCRVNSERRLSGVSDNPVSQEHTEYTTCVFENGGCESYPTRIREHSRGLSEMNSLPRFASLILAATVTAALPQIN